MAGKVDRGEPHATRGSRDEHRFTRLRACSLNQGVVRRPVDMPDRGRRLEVDIGRQKYGLPFLGDHPFREPANPIAARHAVAGPKSRDLVTDRDDNSGPLRARHKWRLRPHLILTRDKQTVHEAD